MTGNRRIKSLCVCALLFSLLFTSFGSIYAFAIGAPYNGIESMYRTSLDDVENVLTATTYEQYLLNNGNVGYGDELSIDIFDYMPIKPEGELTEEQKETVWSLGTIIKKDSLGNSDGPVLICGDNSVVSWKINFPEDARYNILIEYYTGDFDEGDNLAAKSSAAERYVLVDGKVPYKEARSIKFERVWADAYTYLDENHLSIRNEDGSKDTYLSNGSTFLDFVLNQENMSADSDRLFANDLNGNELKPEKTLVETWQNTYLHDSTGFYKEPLSFYFPKGEHTLSLQAIREPLAIKSIKLVEAPGVIDYEEYLDKHSDAKDYTGDESFKIQAEYPVLTSGNTIYALNDRSSSFTEPQDPSLIRLNEIGGDKWQYVGQWIEWQVEVPESGFYYIIPRSQQNFYSGIYVSRKVYINGEVPFEEAGNLRFSYSSEWVTEPLNDGDTNFKFYLEAGKPNTIRLEVVLGDMAEVLREVETSLSNLNGYYRKILMITGPDADEYRDYGFDKLIPDVLKGLKKEAERLENVSEKLTELVGEKGEHSSTLDRVVLTCSRMSSYPDTIASQMKTLKDYTASLGTWLSNTQNQPLNIDYISIQAVDSEPPKAEPGFFKALWYEVKKFFMSFFSDYNSLGATSEDDNSANDVSVVVWTASSRDQAQILRTLVDDNFTPNHEGIAVDIQLIAAGTLLPATLAGTGPDIYLGGAQGDPVNYAIRSAVLSLNHKGGNTKIGYDFTDLENSVWNDAEKYPAFSRLIQNGTVKDFGEVKEWFADEALIPVTLYGETYALPMTMSFSMMFYRKDIFVELGIEVPNTWDDFYDIMYSLQSNSLDIGFPQGTGGSMFLMYQQPEPEPLYDMGNYDYYLDLFRRYHYDGDFDSISDDELAALDEELCEEGLTYYDEDGNITPKTDGMTINLDSDVSLATFKEVCQYFTMYDFPITYDFANRFRSGEMPIAIQDYTSYNTLIIFAPEINGLWEFTPLPGTLDPDTREINNTTIGGISTIMMMNGVSDKEDVAFGSWAFMQWYLSAEVQSIYGNEMVALLGPSAKQPTSNMNALRDMAWSTEEQENLFSQFTNVTCTPEFPGSYIIGRYTSFAFLDVVNNNADPVTELQSYITDINVELARKRSEFGLPTTESVKDMENAVKDKYPDWDERR